MHQYGLRNDQWERIEGFLPGREGHVGRTAKDNRLCVEAVLYRYRADIPWRDLPERFGPFRPVHTRFTRWSRSGVWDPSEKQDEPCPLLVLHDLDKCLFSSGMVSDEI